MSRMHAPNWRWYVCGAMLVATLLNYMDRQALAITAPELKVRYHLEADRYGILESRFGYAFAAGSLFFGWLADRLGPRLLYPAILVGWSLAGVATGYAAHPRITDLLESPGDPLGTGTFLWLLICRTTLGFFEAGHWPCALITARQILSAADRPLGNGILQSGASLGAILVPLYVQIVEMSGRGWEFTFRSIGLAGFLWVPLWFALVRKGDLSGSAPPAADGVPAVSIKLLIRRLLALVIVVSCLNVSWQFLRAWLPLFLQDHHGFTPLATRLITSGYFISADVGCILSGILVRVLARRGWGVHPARLIGFATFAVLTGLAAVVPATGSVMLMVPLLWIAGAGILGLHPYYYALAQELPTRRMGLLSGGLAAVGWVVSGTFQQYIGETIKQTASYDVGLIIGGVAPTVGLMALGLLWRSGWSPTRP
jgi:ACS family hexuronate transporter-like MFS transporter